MPPVGVGMDPRLATSLFAFERALEWYMREVRGAETPPISLEEAIALRAAFASGGPLAPEVFDSLVTFGRAMYRSARIGDAPDCNLGDALTARMAVNANRKAPAVWTFDPTVDPETFRKLEFRDTSAGIAKARKEHREGWWAHAQKNRGFILSAAKAASGQKMAVALGAGQPFDLPLGELADLFDRLVLIDIDQEALAETAAGLAGKHRAHIETRSVDLTGINRALVAEIERGMEESADAEEVERRLASLCRSYRLPAGAPFLGEGERADFLASSCVLSQLSWPQRVFAESLFDKKFGSMPPAMDRRWSTAWSEFGLMLQQDHVNALATAADVVVLTSDVLSRPTRLMPNGTEALTGTKVYALGVDSLLERVPAFFKHGEHAAWEWSRYKASRKGTEGSRMDVEGVVLREAQSASGLWIPQAG